MNSTLPILILMGVVSLLLVILVVRSFKKKDETLQSGMDSDELKSENAKGGEAILRLERDLKEEREKSQVKTSELMALNGKYEGLNSDFSNAKGQRDTYLSELQQVREDLRIEKTARNAFENDLKVTKSLHNLADGECKKLNQKISELSEKCDKVLEDLRSSGQNCSRLTEENKSLRGQLETQAKNLADMGESLKDQFKNVASVILKEHGVEFKTKSQEELGLLLKPFQERLESFNKEVKESRDENLKDRSSLYEQIKMIKDLNTKLHEETNNLTKALKGEAKVQGDWGETILQTLLERSGLEKNQQFKTQVHHQGPGGNTLITDVEMLLPGNRTVVIDSKVSISAYQEFTSTDDDTIRRQRLEAHQRSVKGHIDTLASKEYYSLVDGIEFVIMFVPVEPALQTALQSDENLWQYAYNKKVVLMGPNGLIPCLKLVHDLWRQDKLSKNGEQLAKFGAILHDKLVGVVEDLQVAINQIDKASMSSKKAMDKLSTGNGSATITAQKMKQLGIKAKKQLPDNVVGNYLDVELEEINTLSASIEEE